MADPARGAWLAAYRTSDPKRFKCPCRKCHGNTVSYNTLLNHHRQAPECFASIEQPPAQPGEAAPAFRALYIPALTIPSANRGVKTESMPPDPALNVQDGIVHHVPPTRARPPSLHEIARTPSRRRTLWQVVDLPQDHAQLHRRPRHKHIRRLTHPYAGVHPSMQAQHEYHEHQVSDSTMQTAHPVEPQQGPPQPDMLAPGFLNDVPPALYLDQDQLGYGMTHAGPDGAPALGLQPLPEIHEDVEQFLPENYFAFA